MFWPIMFIRLEPSPLSQDLTQTGTGCKLDHDLTSVRFNQWSDQTESVGQS